jgi:hypothetical protein
VQTMSGLEVNASMNKKRLGLMAHKDECNILVLTLMNYNVLCNCDLD